MSAEVANQQHGGTTGFVNETRGKS